MKKKTAKTLTFFLPNYGDGGLERMFVNLATEISTRGFTVYFIVGDRNKPYLCDLPEPVGLIELTTSAFASRVKEMSRHLDNEKPNVVLTARELGLPIALKAKEHSTSPVKVFYRAVTNITASLSRRHWLKRMRGRFQQRQLKEWYQQADGIIAVSQGIAEDVHRISNIPLSQIHVAHNPVVSSAMLARAEQAFTHNWFAEGQPPVILGVGRFTRQKNFELLIKAFSKVRLQRKARLIILGDGARKEKFINMAHDLGIADDVQLPGFDPNPYTYLRHAALFVLSSNWEGSPNVLTEALAIGCPVVSTDCPSGPRETLQGGKYGSLVPMDDEDAMTQAIIETLDHPLDKATLQQAAAPFHMAASADEYLAAMGLK